ncbi:prenyltransferase [Natronosporangium hydrolyticum]|uniref:prenyltransferase n=1 Tax=Natronosporangium hydrolyticum TaxID=2811111 RepID=UPI003B849B94
MSTGGVLDQSMIIQTAAYIAGLQRPDGQIPWEAGGETDPWDHVEAAMALDVAGRPAAAAAAYEWLVATQNPDGSWCRGYRDDRVTDPVRDANFTAYLGVGMWHHYLSTGDRRWLARLWPTLGAAVEFVLGLQASGGEVDWARGVDGDPAGEALLSGSASIHHSLRCAAAIGRLLNQPRPEWELAAATLRHAILAHPERFSPRTRYSMDWYYPVLGGALRGEPARTRLAAGWEGFVVAEWGARCVADRPWVTVAETCELALSLWAVGRSGPARRLLRQVQRLRCGDGSYWTGYVVPDRAVWPEERTSWTAGAVLLADAALAGEPATRAVFDGGELPAGPTAAELAGVPDCTVSPRCSTRSEPVAAT